MSKYRTLEDRMLHSYLDNMAQEFIPCECMVSEESQRQFYLFIQNIYTTLADNPGILFKEIQEDDCHPNRFNKSSYGKPKLKPAMKKILKEVEDLMLVLYNLGTEGTVTERGFYFEDLRIKKKYVTIFSELGMQLKNGVIRSESYPLMFDAWKMMTGSMSFSRFYRFTHCYYNVASFYTTDVFGKLLGNEKAFYDLERWLKANDFQRVDNVFDKDCLSYNYVKCIGEHTAVIGNGSYDKNYIGVSAWYDPFVDNPAAISVRLPRHKETIDHFDDMTDSLKEFIIKYNAKCSNCGYCIQRFKNKAQQPPKAYRLTEHNGNTYPLCTIFPYYSYMWTYIDDVLVNGIKDIMAFVTTLFKADIKEFITVKVDEEPGRFYI